VSKLSGLKARDLKLLIGFGFFLEVVLAYMLLIDGPLTETVRLQGQLAKAREGSEALRQAVAAREAERRRAIDQKLPTPLTPRHGENLSVAIQRFLNGEIVSSGATMVVLNVRPIVDEKAPAPGYQAVATVEGSYEAIAKLVSRIQSPDVLMGVDTIKVRAGEVDPELLQADLTLSFFFLAPPEKTASLPPGPETSPRP
jgi:hypothetical protein